MRSVRNTSWALLFLIAVGCSESGKETKAPETESPKEKFTIDLHPRERTGARALWKVQSEMSVGYTVDVNGQPTDGETATAYLDLRADVEVLSVDSKGTPTGLRSTVRMSSARVNGLSVPAVPSGTVVESRKIGDQMSLTGLPFVLEPEVTALAEEILSGVEAEGPTDGDMFGTAEPRAIGEKWEINAEQIKEVISSPGFSARDARVNGSATLVGFADVEGTECLHVRANTRISDVEVELPEGLTVLRVGGTMRSNIYLDRATGLRRKDDANVEFEVTARAQGGVEVKLTVLKTLSRTIDRAAQPASN